MSGVYSQWGNAKSREFAVNLLSNIHLMVPCQKCQDHAEKNARMFRLKEKLLKSAEKQHKPLDEGSMFRVMVDFHNVVNRMLGKKQYSLEEAYGMFKHCFVGEVCSLDIDSCFSQESSTAVVDATCTSKVIVLSVSLGIVSAGLIGVVAYIVHKRNNKRSI